MRPRFPNLSPARKCVIVLVSLFFIGVAESDAANSANIASPHPSEQDRHLQIGSPATGTRTTTDRLGSHYVMLVNTALASGMNTRKLVQFARSPYDGLAVSFAGAYDTATVLSTGAMESGMSGWKTATTKDIWPWVYLTRMIGVNEAEGNALSNVPYFQRFQGVDLDGQAGAQKDFLENWRNALRLARNIGAPGIVCDLEFYNNYKAYDVGELARMAGKSPAETVTLLRQVGTRMADAAAAEYPGAVLWFLFTGFTRPEYRMIASQPYYMAATYIAEGLLDQIQRQRLPLRFLTGGEASLGYCHNSVEDLRQAIHKRANDFAPILKKYDGILELAGTMTLWSDRSAKRSWVGKGSCGTSSAATVEELEPYMELLFRSYRYNWIYGSVNGGYLAFQPDVAPRFDAAISQAKAVAAAKPAR